MVATDRAVFDFAGAPFLTDFVRDDDRQGRLDPLLRPHGPPHPLNTVGRSVGAFCPGLPHSRLTSYDFRLPTRVFAYPSASTIRPSRTCIRLTPRTLFSCPSPKW